MSVALLKEQFEEILADLSTGMSLIKSVTARGIHSREFYRYINADEEACRSYARAKSQGLKRWADEILEIADTTEEGVKIKESKDGIETTRGDMIEHRKLRIDARKWLLAKLAPKEYGDKLEIDSAGPITVEIHERDA